MQNPNRKFKLSQLRCMPEDWARRLAAANGYVMRVISRDGRVSGELVPEQKSPSRVNVVVVSGKVVSVQGVY